MGSTSISSSLFLHKVKADTLKWLEMAIAVDGSVIEFHGRDSVEQYVLTLLNIVSAIYGDPTLGAKLKFVINRIIFYEGVGVEQEEEEGSGAMENPIDPGGNSKRSLENVNAWNEDLLRELDPTQKHDIAIWLTKQKIGGPSGYAPGLATNSYFLFALNQ